MRHSPHTGAQLLYRLPPVAAIVGLILALLAGAGPLVLQPLALLAVLLAPALLPRAVLYPGAADQPPDAGDGGERGGGRGPEPEPSKPPPAPRGGGLPLPDADPAPVRRRDHDRPRLMPRRPRRPVREPDRAPQRERLGRRGGR